MGWVHWGWIVAIYLVGGLFWAQFLNQGNIDLNYHDWAEVNAPRLAFVQDALKNGQFPFHMNGTGPLRGVSDRYLVIPDVISTPQMGLLLFLPIGQYVLANQLILYTLGTLGLVWIQRKYGLSLIVYTALFFLFNFNGHILAHFSVGHANWGGYFFFPWLIGLFLDPGQTPHGWGWTAKVACVMFLILLQGSFHHFVWIVLFLGLWAMTSWKRFGLLVKTALAAGLLGAVRLLPPVLGLERFDHTFLSGYPSITDLLSSMTTLKTIAEAILSPYSPAPVGYWELNVYLGLIGTLFLLVFGLARWLKTGEEQPHHGELALPLLGLSVLSIGNVYRLVSFLPIPLLNGERVSSRMIIVPVTILLVLAAIEAQRWLEQSRPDLRLRLAVLALIAVMIADLWAHLQHWRVEVAARTFPTTPVELSRFTAANHPDPTYLLVVLAGGVITLMTAGTLLVLTAKERNHSR